MLLIAALIAVSMPGAHADVIVHEMGSTASNTLSSLGKYFMFACGLLAAGLVGAALILKMK